MMMNQINNKNFILKNKREFLGALVTKPKNLYFSSLDKDEKVYVLIRSHWIVNLSWIINLCIYFIIPLIVYFILPIFIDLIQLDIGIFDIPNRVWIVILFAYYSIVLTYAFNKFIDWYFDIFLVTNKRIIDIEFSPLGGYKVLETPLINVQDIKEESRSFLGLIFNYGNIKARTSAEQSILMLERVPKPLTVRDIIADLVNIAKHGYKHNI
jgi:hypothetical protein